jgi:hypothetical protein
MADAHTAWAAGLFEGEGTITRSNGRARLAIKMTDEETVRRFHKTVGAGVVYGPYPNRAGERDGYPRRDYWLWLVEGKQAAEIAIRLYPWLGQIRRDRVDEVMPIAESEVIA